MAERELKATLAEKRDGVGIITLNRPEKLNAINQDIMDDLYYLFDAYEEDRIGEHKTIQQPNRKTRMLGDKRNECIERSYFVIRKLHYLLSF